uniref:ZMYM2-like/QRICH1 C-terminal domain-containing protein n=1 Tax=Cyanoderma ruficeps TaxID=181631 RepID=A0A8C3QPC7_9PASS
METASGLLLSAHPLSLTFSPTPLQSKSARDGGHSDASSLLVDLSKLVDWAHTHGTICNQIPTLEFVQDMDFLSNNNAGVWMCESGHAYYWPCGKLDDRGEEGTKAVGRIKRILSSESLARESSFEEKRLKLTPSSFEMGQADSGSTGSSGRSQGVTEQKADSAYTRNNKPEGNQNTRKPITSFSATEQHFSMSGSRVQTCEQDVKSKNDEDLQVVCDEEYCEVDEDNQGDRISQDNVSEPSAEELQMLRCQNMALHQPTASQRAAFAATARPPLAHAYILQACVSDSEDLSRNILRPGPFTAAGPMAETYRARSLSGSAAPKVCFKPLPVPSTEAKAQLESQPLETFFELQVSVDVQQLLQLSPPEGGTPGMASSRDGAENMGEDSNTSGSGQRPCSSALQSPESHPPAASNRDVPKRKEKRIRHAPGEIKVFKEWLKLHHPTETREIHALPPADLNHYLVLFFISAKRQNGIDFSASSLSFFQHDIYQYLKDHNYQYNMLRGPEFRASQEAYKVKHWYLFQKKEEKKEKEWSLVENLTDEDVENLCKKGILSKTHPQGLLHLMLTNLIRGFGVRTHYQAHQLYWGQVVLRKTKGEVEYLEWKDDLSPGENKGLSPRLFAKPEDPDNCPVASYKQYARKRPLDTLNDNHPLYLSPKSLCSVWDKEWYSRKALPKAKIDKIMKVITQDIRGAIRNTKK